MKSILTASTAIPTGEGRRYAFTARQPPEPHRSDIVRQI